MNAYYETYASMVGILTLSIVWDFIPVMLLLVFHLRNFRERDHLRSNSAKPLVSTAETEETFFDHLHMSSRKSTN